MELKTLVVASLVIAMVAMLAVNAQSSEGNPPIVNPLADPIIIPEDTDEVPLWGEMVTIDVTDDSAISTVTVDLSAMGGSPITTVSKAGNYYSDGTLWCVFNVTNASVGTAKWNATSGTYEPYYLQVNATDIYGNWRCDLSCKPRGRYRRI
jgi:hypothetical protein